MPLTWDGAVCPFTTSYSTLCGLVSREEAVASLLTYLLSGLWELSKERASAWQGEPGLIL